MVRERRRALRADGDVAAVAAEDEGGGRRGGSGRAWPAGPRRAPGAALADRRRLNMLRLPMRSSCRMSTTWTTGSSALMRLGRVSSVEFLAAPGRVIGFERGRRAAERSRWRCRAAPTRSPPCGRGSAGCAPACTTARAPRRPRRRQGCCRAGRAPNASRRRPALCPLPSEPARTRRHTSKRSPSPSSLCQTVTLPGKRAANRRIVCGVSAISGTSTTACCPCSSAFAMAAR